MENKNSASKISNKKLNQIYEKANARALSGKISGAGGGGFLCFFLKPENRTNLVNELEDISLTVTNFNITNSGSKAEYIVGSNNSGRRFWNEVKASCL